MESFLRVARPVAVIAAMWALGWSVVGVGFGIIFGLILGAAASISVFLSVIGNSIVGMAVLGFFAGVVFALAFPWLSSFPHMIGTIMSVAIFGSLGVASSLGLLRVLRAPLGAGAKAVTGG